MKMKHLGMILVLIAELPLAAQQAQNEGVAKPGESPRIPLSCRADLWIKDTPSDTGQEPDPATIGQPMWQSQDIWVRNTNTNGPHQNPEYGQTNYIHVRVRNRGMVTATNVPVEVYFANASVGLAWWMDWHLIGVATIPSLAPGGMTDVVVPWNPPGPPPPDHFCLVSRINTPQDPMTFAEIGNIDYNVRQNNNLAWRNVNVVDLVHHPIVKATFNYRNPTQSRLRSKLLFREQRGGEGFLQRGQVTVDLGPKLAELWKKGGSIGRGIKLINRQTIAVSNDGFIVVPLSPRQEFDLGLTFQDNRRRVLPPPTRRTEARPSVPSGQPARYTFEIVQQDADKGTELGGILYQIDAPALP
jgi:extracellular elastinolytic metalloproteinase